MKTLIPKLVGALINCIGFFNASYASKLALKLFSKPRSGQLTSSANLFLESANKKTLFYNDTPIQTYHWKGDKETLLLAHGWESNTSLPLNAIANISSSSTNFMLSRVMAIFHVF